jgi:copper chaperone NosL
MKPKTGFLVTILLAAMVGLSACGEDPVAPTPVSMTREAVGYYCNMIIVDHPGPKAQIFEEGVATPFWFSSVRDAVFYNTLPGEGTNIVAAYVQDSAAILDWNNPPADGPWIAISDAIYVINSSRKGGMGANETVPFTTREGAENFRTEFGGEIVAFSEIPADYLTGN